MKPLNYLILSSSLLAAEPEKLETTVVKSTKETLTQPTLEQERLDLARIPGGTEVVDSERYLTGRSSTMADTFYLSPGVVAQSRFGSDEARISIRGSGIQRTFHGRGIKLMQDGIPLNLADGGFDMQSIDPLAVAYINVWRGGTALANGSTTLGGAIDYISHTGRSAPGYSARLEGGSYDYLRARVAGAIDDGSKDFYFSLSEAYQKGFRDHADQSAQRLLTNFGIALRDDLETRFYLTAIHTDSELPGSITKAKLEADPRQADLGAIRFNIRRDYELFRIGNKTTLRDGNNTWDFSAGYTYKDLDHPLTFGVIDQLSNDFTLRTVFTNTDDLAERENRFSSGFIFTYGNTTSSTFANNLGYRGALSSRDEQTATNFEGFVENQHHLIPDLTLTTALAASYSTRENNREFPALAPAFTSYDNDYSNIAPNIGLLYEKNDIQYFCGFSTSFEPPSFSEAVTANIARDAQTANTIEAGSRGTYSFARWDATIYYSKVKDELLTLTDPTTLISATRNADHTTHSGLELGTEFDLLGPSWIEESPINRLVFRTAYTYGNFRFDNDPTYGDNRLAGLPPHLIRGELLWENEQGYYAGPTFEWVPVKSYIDERNTFAADPYALLGFKFGRRVGEGISWFVEAKNLTDERYAATTGVIDNAGGTDRAQFLPGDGRSVFAGIEWKF